MPTCGTIVPLRRAQKCPLNRIVAPTLLSYAPTFPAFAPTIFCFAPTNVRCAQRKLLCCRAHGVTNIYIYCSSFASFAPHALSQRSPARSGKVKGVLGNFSRTVQTFSGVDGWHRQVVGRRGSLCRSWWWRCWCVPKPWR